MSIRNFAGGAIAAIALVFVALACGSGHGNGPTIALTGCLQPGSAPDTYQLNAVAAPNGAVGTSGGGQSNSPSNPTGSSTQSNTSDIGAATSQIYTLVPGKNVDLNRDQGTMVSITGHLEETGNGQGPSAAGASNSQGQGQQSKAVPQTHDNSRSSGSRDQTGSLGGEQGNGANPTTGQGPQSFAQGRAGNRAEQVVHVDAEHRVTGDCGTTR